MASRRLTGALLGDYDGTQPLFEALATAAPADPRYVLQLGLIDAHRGKRVEAGQTSDRVRALGRPYDLGRTKYALAQIAAVLGDRDAAVAHLRKALAEGTSYGRLHANRDLASLRDDPRFRELFKPKG